HGSAYVARLRAGASPRAVCSVPPGDDWPAMLAEVVAAGHAAGRGVIVCLPDSKDVTRLDAALTALLGPGHHVSLGAGAGPARRYREFLAVSRGTRRIVVGTRSAAFAPVHHLGLLVIWDDGDDLHAEPRAPYPHTREVLLLRAEQEGAAVLLAGFARSVEATYLLRTGWAREIAPTRSVLRERVTVEVVGGEQDLDRDLHAMTSRFPQQAHRRVREALASGPVLVQTPRHGYVTSLASDRCRPPARGGVCTGPLALARATSPPACRWCGTETPGWSCAECGGHGLRAPVLGNLRTAEELGRAFPGVRVHSSSGDGVLASVGAEHALVVATPGAEPVAETGYAAVVLLDTWLLLSRVDLRAEEEALRRWSNAVGLVRPGGRAIAVGDPTQPALQALVRSDQPGFAERETRERQQAHLPPASRLATITGSPGAVDDAVTLLAAPEALEVLGPVAVGDPSRQESRVVLRVPRARAAELSGALVEMQRVRAARKLDAVRVQVDPPSL
ncbi:MAG: primosome assembly protein PriA, partial [Nocardioides sp.]|nr:primosome assembly protein PriA [Nocardioides sp.]